MSEWAHKKRNYFLVDQKEEKQKCHLLLFTEITGKLNILKFFRDAYKHCKGSSKKCVVSASQIQPCINL